MRKITQQVTEAFLNHQPLSKSNSHTDGTSLYLHGNLIAIHRASQIYITSAGWETNTTKERLNALPGVSITQKQGQWYLNGYLWENSNQLTNPRTYTHKITLNTKPKDLKAFDYQKTLGIHNIAI